MSSDSKQLVNNKMFNIYVPELMELDSYWQKAVEDAIRDTLKDEKKLHCALKNRKIINQKLENLGLRHVRSQIFLSDLPPSESESMEDQKVSDSESSEKSRSSFEGKSKELDPDGIDPDFERRSRSSDNRDPPFGEKHKNPERPLLGNGSLEKMKKSQNSFNCEPMGMENLNEEVSEEGSEKEYNMDCEVNSNEFFPDERDKKVKWLHVRDDSDFEGSDVESVKDAPEDEDSEDNEFSAPAYHSNENYFANKNSSPRLSHNSRKRKNSSTQQNTSSQEDLFWKRGVKNALKKAADSQRKLQMDLVKKDVFKKNPKESSTGRNIAVKANKCKAKIVENRKKNKKYMTPFIKFYLELHKELGHKYSTAQIIKKAGKRWRAMNKAQKFNYVNSMHKN